MTNFIIFYEQKKLIGLHKTILFFYLLFCSFFSFSQTISSSTQNIISSGLLFERFYSRDGLPDDRIRTIFQDSKGFLWLGTMNGVARYDGYNFTKYFKSRKINSISGNWAYSITEDSDNNIWIGTKEGLNKFDTKNNKFEVFVADNRDPNSIISNVINSIQFDGHGKLWIGTPKGLSYFDPLIKKFINFKVYPLNTQICKIINSYGDYIWVATKDGVVRLNVVNHKFQFYKIDVKPNAYGDKFWSMLEYNKNLYLTTGGNGLVEVPYQPKTRSYGNYVFINDFTGGSLEKTEIFDICMSKRGDIWLGTTGYGLAKIENIKSSKRKISFYKNNPLSNQSISNNQVYKVFIDKTDVLWCGTEQGLNKLDLHLLPFKYYTFMSGNSKDQVRSICTVDGKSIWFGTSKSGLYNYSLQSGISKNFRFSDYFLNANRSLLVNNDDIWNGTLGGALKLKLSNSNYSNEISKHAVFAFLKDSKGNIWAGTNNGLYEINSSGVQTNFLPNSSGNSIKSKFVRSLYEDHKGNIWIGFENGEVTYYNPNIRKFTAIGRSEHGQKIFGNIVFSIVEYPKNVIWIGSESGLNKITFSSSGKYSVKNYFEEDGLPDKSVNGIISDDIGNLWISTIKGLVKFNIKKEHFQTYLANITFNYSGYFKLNPKYFLFTCSDGFLMFNPKDIHTDTTIPEVVISDFKLFNKSVNINEKYNGDVILKQSILRTKEITLDYYNNQFSLEFAALHFSNPSGNSFAYKMEGFDEEWTYVNSENRIATYTNLNAGTYTFLVKASNYSGKWNENPQTLKITILPPPWKTWWAILFYVILLNGLLFVFIKYILIQSKQRQQILFEQREKEQLKKLDQMKVKFFTNISHEFRTPLSLIVGPVEDILHSNETNDSIKTSAQHIYRNSKKLLYLLDELMTFQKMEQGMLKLKKENANIVQFTKEIYDNFYPFAAKRNIHFDFFSSKKTCFLDFDLGKIEMVINNLLSNAFKFAKAEGIVKLNLGFYNVNEIPELVGNLQFLNWVCISIEDNGKGIEIKELNNLFKRFYSESDVKGTGVGLSLTKKLVKLHEGIIIVESVPYYKTIFKVYLPIINTVLNQESHQNYALDYDISILLEDSVSIENTESTINQEGKILLIVDDNLEVLDYLEMIFKDKYIVVRAENGVQALDYTLKNMPDIIISDVMMPEMDGVALCQAVKTNVNVSHIPIILLSAKSTVEDTLLGLQIGADDYIPKPFHPNILRLKVKKLIDAQKQQIDKLQDYDGIFIPKDVLKNPLDEKFLNKVIECIKANISNDELSVEELGSMVAMSRSNLFRKLKAITGQTPIEFIYYIRLKHSMDLLLERKLSISDIAYEVGFKNPSSFTRSFKKQFGKSPSEYLRDVIEFKKNKDII